MLEYGCIVLYFVHFRFHIIHEFFEAWISFFSEYPIAVLQFSQNRTGREQSMDYWYIYKQHVQAFLKIFFQVIFWLENILAIRIL